MSRPFAVIYYMYKIRNCDEGQSLDVEVNCSSERKRRTVCPLHPGCLMEAIMLEIGNFWSSMGIK